MPWQDDALLKCVNIFSVEREVVSLSADPLFLPRISWQRHVLDDLLVKPRYQVA